MHEEVETVKTRLYAAQVAEKSVLNDLYDFREKILSLYLAYETTKGREMEKLKNRPKTYVGPALNLIDPEQSKKIRAIESKIKKKMQWKGDEELEELCNMFVVQLTAPSGINLEDDDKDKVVPPEATSPSKVASSPTKLSKAIKEEANEDDTEQSHIG